jgi:hypothetical protein
VIAGRDPFQIVEQWTPGLEAWKKLREEALIYRD